MSRLIVKQLPHNVTETELKELFSQKGVVTDVQLKYTEDGIFRRFGFVGYKTEEEANEAVEYFNGTSMNSQKIKVQKISDSGDANKPKSCSKDAPDSNAHETLSSKLSDSKKSTGKDKKSKKKKDKTIEESNVVKDKKSKKKKDKTIEENNVVKEALEKHTSDPESHQVSDVDKASNKTKSEKENSSNDDEDNDDEETKETSDNKDEKISDLEYMEASKEKSQPDSEKIEPIKEKSGGENEQLFTVKIRGLGYNHKKQKIKEFFRPLKVKSIRVLGNVQGIAYVGFKTEKIMNEALKKNKSMLEDKRLILTKYDGEKDQDDKNIKNNGDADKVSKDLQPTGSDDKTNMEKQSDTTIMVTNVPFQATHKEILELFKAFGVVKSSRLPKKTGGADGHRGFGFIEYYAKEPAKRAFEALSQSTHLYGRRLNLEWATPRKDMEDNRKRTAKHFHQDKAPAKRSKKLL